MRNLALNLVAETMVLVLLVCLGAPPRPDRDRAQPIEAGGEMRTMTSSDLVASLSRTLGGFTENQGQFRNVDVRYYTTVGDVQVGFSQSAVFLFRSHADGGAVVRLVFKSANPTIPTGLGQMASRIHYFVGQDPSLWRTDLRQFEEVRYRGLYPGIDLEYRLGPRGLKYTFIVRPGGNLEQIVMEYEGIEKLGLDSEGVLGLYTVAGMFRDASPEAWTDDGTKVGCAYERRGSLSIGFACGPRAPSQTLFLDPLLYATYLGGGSWEQAYAMSVDHDGNVYVAGYTESKDFPVTSGTFQNASLGRWDVFVAKLSPAGSALIYATYLGGSSVDVAFSLGVDASGNAYLAGITYSSDFPVSPGAYQTILHGVADGFAVKLNPTGNALVYATYLGGAAVDYGRALALDAAGDVTIAGLTTSLDFPATPGAYQGVFRGSSDAFVAKLNPQGSALIYATYLGGSGSEEARAIASGAAGDTFVAGQTASTDFPATPGASQTTLRGTRDAFVAKLNPAGSALIYATYLGGNLTDGALSVAIDAGGNAYIGGFTDSTSSLATPGAFQTAMLGLFNGFVAKLNPAGNALIFSTYLGGTGFDRALAIAVDDQGEAAVTGFTDSSDFPTTPDAVQRVLHGSTDAFLARLSATGSRLAYGTYLGGSGEESGNAIALDRIGNVYVTGNTTSSDFPATSGAFQEMPGAYSDAFMVAFGRDTAAPTIEGLTVGPSPQDLGGVVTIFATVTDNVAVGSVSVNVTLPDGTHANRTMASSSGDIYGDDASWTEVGAHRFVIWADDTSGNWASATGSFTMRAPDRVPLTIVHTPPGPVFTGEDIPILANVTDDNPVREVRLLFTPVNGQEQNVTMMPSDGSYTYTVPRQSSAGTILYRIYALDSAGSTALTEEHEVKVVERPTMLAENGLIVLTLIVIALVLAAAASLNRRRRQQKGGGPPPE